MGCEVEAGGEQRGYEQMTDKDDQKSARRSGSAGSAGTEQFAPEAEQIEMKPDRDKKQCGSE